ncbi:hypothetical protein [Bosea sp. (in: a-proteobacteria)]|uniref:hypothetical protein n=1 Tax=Bosea sp. (in: a-proteobacteria) TaxID=1871050 RepID=UPI0026387A49|nr:hypothetical protein [Bosea sp. (in: a-proteobacteria)]MCO5091021.1 hypothetical protein [Bosea sp. (in: a-proteobacteria)]
MRFLFAGVTAAQVAIAAVALTAGGVPAFAQGAPAVTLASLPGKASSRQVEDFKANPAAFLRANPIGGPQMSAITKALTLADPGLVDALLAAATDGSALQRAAIGSGLGQAVKAIDPADKALADAIAAKIAGSGLTDVMAGYSAGISDVQTLATGGGGGGGGGGAGAGVGGPVGGFMMASGGGRPSTGPGSSFTGNNGQHTTYGSGNRGYVECTESVSPRRRC